MWTKGSADAYNGYTSSYSWKLTHFQKTAGYLSVPLEGLWLRAPYLHNGSVPTLADLLAPPEARPTQFWRGYDLLDPVKVGFVSDGPAAEAMGSHVDTSRPGNGNGGHTWGTTLPPEEKQALVEYMKTL